MTLVRENITSLYRQIADTLRQEIAAGHFQPGGKLPSEAALEQRFVGGLRFARTEKNVNPSAMSRGIDQYFSISGIPRRVRPPKESPPQSVNNPTSRASAKPKYMMMRCPTLPPRRERFESPRLL